MRFFESLLVVLLTNGIVSTLCISCLRTLRIHPPATQTRRLESGYGECDIHQDDISQACQDFAQTFSTYVSQDQFQKEVIHPKQNPLS